MLKFCWFILKNFRKATSKPPHSLETQSEKLQENTLSENNPHLLEAFGSNFMK